MERCYPERAGGTLHRGVLQSVNTAQSVDSYNRTQKTSEYLLLVSLILQRCPSIRKVYNFTAKSCKKRVFGGLVVDLPERTMG